MEEFVSDCTCLSITPPQLTLETQQTASVTLELDLMHYLTPEMAEVVHGTAHFSPVIAGRLEPGWTLALTIIPPKILCWLPEIDFGTVFRTDVPISSTGVLYVRDAQSTVTVQSDTQAVKAVQLECIGVGSSRYTKHRIVLTLADGICSGSHQFTLTASDATASSETIPCLLRVDDGVRTHTIDPIPVVTERDANFNGR